jgi:hypothetical protein
MIADTDLIILGFLVFFELLFYALAEIEEFVGYDIISCIAGLFLAFELYTITGNDPLSVIAAVLAIFILLHGLSEAYTI